MADGFRGCRFVDEQLEWFKNLSGEKKEKLLREERDEYDSKIEAL